jgi:hypothetical protein
VSFGGADLSVELGQVEGPDELPDDAGGVVVGQLLAQGGGGRPVAVADAVAGSWGRHASGEWEQTDRAKAKES